MPSKSKKQHRFMSAVAHNKAFADKVDVPQSVGRDFVDADKQASKFTRYARNQKHRQKKS